MAALLLGLLAVLPVPTAAATHLIDETAVHRLTIGLYAYAYDDPDGLEFKPPFAGVPANPTFPPPYSNATIVNLPERMRSSPFFDFGELSHGTGEQLAWWRGPFLDANGFGALPEDGPVRLCFKKAQRCR